MSYLGYDEKKYRPSIQLCSSRAKLSTYIRVGKVITEVTRTNTDLRFSNHGGDDEKSVIAKVTKKASFT